MSISASALTVEALKDTMPVASFFRSTESHNKDKVSMGTIAARDAARVCTLTERVVAILRQLPPLFHYTDVQKFSANANVFLTRALARGLVERVVRGVYLNMLRDSRPTLEGIACFLRTPSYVSCEWALNRHGVLLQAPAVCTVLTLGTAVGASRNLPFGGVTIEFSRIAPRLFTGFETRDGYNLALPGKALLDAIHLRKAIPFRDELEIDRLDLDRLLLWAESFPLPTRKLAATMISSS